MKKSASEVRERQVLTEKPPWDPNDREDSLERYTSWLNSIAREAFLQDGHHPEMFTKIRELTRSNYHSLASSRSHFFTHSSTPHSRKTCRGGV